MDDTKKPIEIPKSKWVVKDVEYTITHIYNHVNQKGIKGVELAELDISMYTPYNSFRLDRFAIHKDDFDKLAQMIKESIELNDIDISNILETLTLLEEV